MRECCSQLANVSRTMRSDIDKHVVGFKFWGQLGSKCNLRAISIVSNGIQLQQVQRSLDTFYDNAN